MDQIVIEPLPADFILWRCLHGGPLTRETLEQWEPNARMPWAELRARNVPLLQKLTATYGACAMVARDGERVVGQLRFYPRAVWVLAGVGHLCLQQSYPAGPADDLVHAIFPPLVQITDKTLMVHCLMTGSPSQKENSYQRRGLGTRLVRELIAWARQNGWQAIEATAYEDLEIVYAITGQAGRTFWEKLGFQIVAIGTEPGLVESDFGRLVREQTAARGLEPAAASRKYTMRLELT